MEVSGRATFLAIQKFRQRSAELISDPTREYPFHRALDYLVEFPQIPESVT